MDGKEITISGWVNRIRDRGSLIFILLRDHSGIVQINIDESIVSKELFDTAKALKTEYVVSIKGKICLRGEKDINYDMKTGKIEIKPNELIIISKSELVPFPINDDSVSESLRMKYRYLDLRGEKMQKNLRTRSRISLLVRNFLHSNGFTEIETPILTNSSPEGARDYLVPSRVWPGKFYALPQSPQILKQILMIGGFDRYFQIAKCLRDEDLRADRQPEFTQIDIEMSFVDIDDIINLSESLLKYIFEEFKIELDNSIPRLTFAEAMDKFGSDKPDIRFEMHLQDISNIVCNSEFPIFKNALENNGYIRAIVAKNCSFYSRKQIDSLIEFSKEKGLGGLAWISIDSSFSIKSSISKFFDIDSLKNIAASVGAKENDLIFIAAGGYEILEALGQLRIEIAKRENLLDNNIFKPLWITEFPLLEWNQDENRFFAKHHPFTSIMDEDILKLEDNPSDARAKAYDLVINGYELGGGSIRIHNQILQEKMFNALGYTKEQAIENFKHLMDALQYGTPPHGGIAWGLDRLAMLICRTNNIRDVIAFPKNQDGICPLTLAPNSVSENQLEEIKISLKE